MPEYPLLDLATQRPEPGHYVYRLFDASGLLLYVGSTGNVWERFGQHAGRLRHPWWDDIDWPRTLIEIITFTACSGKRCPLSWHAMMLQREVELIQLLEPRHNKNSTNHCKTGRHRMTPENTYVQPGGGRTCKECRAERWANLPEEKRRQYAEAAKPTWAAWREAHREETRARLRTYKQNPEIKARAAEVQRAYRARPEVRERLLAQQRERRARKKASDGQG